jgi:hypothetical protein
MWQELLILLFRDSAAQLLSNLELVMLCRLRSVLIAGVYSVFYLFLPHLPAHSIILMYSNMVSDILPVRTGRKYVYGIRFVYL